CRRRSDFGNLLIGIFPGGLVSAGGTLWHFGAVESLRRKPVKEKRSRTLSFHSAAKSFIGYLEGTQKAFHTIESYRSDLGSFHDFLEKHFGSKKVQLDHLQLRDLERYHQHLRTLRLSTNTRRRKLLTVRRFLRYLNKRKKIDSPQSERLATPYKVERIPLTVPADVLIRRI